MSFFFAKFVLHFVLHNFIFFLFLTHIYYKFGHKNL